MRVAIVSDIHGNRPAFEAVLAEVDAAAPDELWCLGDLVGYGAEPDACVALARERCDLCLVGNHDLAVRGDLRLDDFSPAAGLAAYWTRERIRPDSLAYLAGLAPAETGREVGLYHASPRDPVWEYVVEIAQAAECLDVQARRVCAIGHSHVALSFSRPPGGVPTGDPRRAGEAIDVGSGEWLLNPGSVGQPRDGDPDSAWMLLDTGAWTSAYHRTPYDVAAAADAIRAAGLPSYLADRLEVGQ